MTRIQDVQHSLFRSANPHYHRTDMIRHWAGAATDSRVAACQVEQAVEYTLDRLAQSGSCLHLLDLSGYSLTTLPPFSIMRQLEGVTILDLRDNHLPGRELEKLSALTSLKQLYLSGNPLGEVSPDALNSQSHISILEMAGCQLRTFPTDILDLSHLDTLDISNNLIACLPNNLGFCLPCLATLNVCQTEIRELPDSLQYLEALTVLREKVQ